MDTCPPPRLERTGDDDDDGPARTPAVGGSEHSMQLCSRVDAPDIRPDCQSNCNPLAENGFFRCNNHIRCSDEGHTAAAAAPIEAPEAVGVPCPWEIAGTCGLPSRAGRRAAAGAAPPQANAMQRRTIPSRLASVLHIRTMPA